MWPACIKALGYLGLFLLGLRWMSWNLAHVAGPALRRALVRLTGTPWGGFCSGCLVTAAWQSSSLTSVTVVGLVNAGVLRLEQAVAVIIGANVGTTITAQFLSLELHHLAWPVFLISGLLAARRTTRRAGLVLLSFGLVLAGLGGVACSLVPLAKSPWFIGFLHSAAVSPWKGICAGFTATAAVQSSSAVAGIVLGLCLEGKATLPAAIALLIGADLGTALTALIASLGMNRVARYAAWSHFIYNLISLFLALPFFGLLVNLARFSAVETARQLANAHTIYNLAGALILLPLAGPVAAFVEGKRSFCQ